MFVTFLFPKIYLLILIINLPFLDKKKIKTVEKIIIFFFLVLQLFGRKLHSWIRQLGYGRAHLVQHPMFFLCGLGY